MKLDRLHLILDEGGNLINSSIKTKFLAASAFSEQQRQKKLSCNTNQGHDQVVEVVVVVAGHQVVAVAVVVASGVQWLSLEQGAMRLLDMQVGLLFLTPILQVLFKAELVVGAVVLLALL